MLSLILSTNRRRVFILLFSVLIVIIGCTKDIDNLTFVPPSINNISPDNGPGDTEVTITGMAFPIDINSISVFFNDNAATINSVTPTEIKAIVPRGAQTGIVKIVVNGEEILGPEFGYILTPAQVTTVAGSEMSGDIDGPIAQALLGSPWGAIPDETGALFISDSGNKKIKKIDLNGIVTTIAGTGELGTIDGPLTEATFGGPRNMAFDMDGNIVVTDLINQTIRKVDFSGTGSVSTIAGTGVVGLVNGDATIAQFSSPIGIAIDANDNIYISELGNATIRKITPNNMVSSLVGTGMPGFVDGTPDIAQISFAAGMAIDNDGNIIFADAGNHSIRKVTPEGVLSTIAGTGMAGDVNGASDIAQFAAPLDVDIDSEGNIYVVDFTNQKIRKIAPDGMVSTHTGTGINGSIDGILAIATFNNPRSLTIDENDNIYVVTDHSIRKIAPEF